MQSTMESFTTSLLVDNSPGQVFDAIKDVRHWWSLDIMGASDKPGDEFVYQYGDAHRCRMRIVEVIPDQRITWLVLENYFSFTKDESEWTGTTVVFEIRLHGKQTELKFTHEGLVPEFECYEACRKGWTQYVDGSLYDLITTGKGAPNSGTTV